MKFKQRLVAAISLIIICVVYILLRRTGYTRPIYPVVKMNDENLEKILDSLSPIKQSTRKHIDEAVNMSRNLVKIKTTQKINKIQADLRNPWDIWSKMVVDFMVTPNSTLAGLQIKAIIKEMVTARIKMVDVGFKGTQLKASMFLEGDQRVVFKPKRYEKDFVIPGKIYHGFDRHFGEIAAFHLDRLLGFYRAPIVTGRVVNVKREILPVTSERLKKTFFRQGEDICFYGVCYYCKREEAACGNGDMMEASLTIWLPPGYKLVTSRHPWQRTYNDRRKARWETDSTYCDDVKRTPPYNQGPRLNSIIDTAIFDFLIGNGDRHHYETFDHLGPNGLVLHLDNGKSFGNPEVDEMSILAPLYQCCRILYSTWARLNELNHDKTKSLSKKLNESLSIDAISPVLTDAHLAALNRRLTKIISEVEKCVEQHGQENVVVRG